MTDAQRKAVIAEALTWKGTPYHSHASVKGAGADCGMFPLAVYNSLDLLKETVIPYYSPQWGLHRDEELYLAAVERLGATQCEAKDPANFIIFKWGRTYSHGGIIIEWPTIIHASARRGVMLSSVEADMKLAHREHKVFTV